MWSTKTELYKGGKYDRLFLSKSNKLEATQCTSFVNTLIDALLSIYD
jgi:hypothetical protein